jgi:hypothetical protein
MSALPEPDPADRRESVRVDRERSQSSDATRQFQRVGGGPERRERQERVVRDAAVEGRLRVAKATEVIWLLVGFLEGLLALRVLFKLIGANPQNAFASFIYEVTDFFLAPFVGITGSPSTDGVVLEIPTLIAMLVYLLFAWALVKLVWVVFDPTTSRSSSTYERDDRSSRR